MEIWKCNCYIRQSLDMLSTQFESIYYRHSSGMLWSGVMPAKFQLTLCISQHLLLSMINDTFSSLYNSVTNTNFSTPARCLQSWCILILTILTLKACARPPEQWNNVFNRVRQRVSGAIMLVTVINCNSGYQCVMSRSGT